MKIKTLIFTVVILEMLNAPSAAADAGTKILTLQNETYSCINVKKQLVDFWILSARVPKKETFWTDTKGVGVRVDVHLANTNNEGVSFPAAAQINSTDLNDKVIRVSLSLHVLDQNNLWDESSSGLTKTKSVSLPVSFVRRHGTSDTVKVMQALINFTNQNSSSMVPATPFANGTKLFGEFFNSLNTVFQPDPSEVLDPNFQLSFGLGRSDSGCSDMELRDGVGVQISDSADGKAEDGVIKVGDVDNYCFYKHGNNEDPDIVYSPKNGDNCPTNIPANFKTLRNPQIIWLAYGTCKDDNADCTHAQKVSLSDIKSLQQFAPGISDVLGIRLGKKPVHTDVIRIKASIQDADLATFNKASAKSKKLVHGLARCRGVGISPERCFDRRFASPLGLNE